MKRSTRKHLKIISVIAAILTIYLIFIVGINNPVDNQKTLVVKKPIYNSVPNRIDNYKVLSTFNGSVTAYTADCPKCSGKLACNAGYDVSKGQIYYYDQQFGELRIVAADRKYPCGTVLLASIGETKMMVIVMDRGVDGNKMDLLSASYADCRLIGFQRNIKYEVLRYGY